MFANRPEIWFTHRLRFNTMPLVNRGCVGPCKQHHSVDEGYKVRSSPVLCTTGSWCLLINKLATLFRWLLSLIMNSFLLWLPGRRETSLLLTTSTKGTGLRGTCYCTLNLILSFMIFFPLFRLQGIHSTYLSFWYAF